MAKKAPVRSSSIADPCDIEFDVDIALRNIYCGRLRRKTVHDPYKADTVPVPDVPEGGTRIRVCFAGACYTNEDMIKTQWMRLSGVRDTSLFPGFEVSGVVDELCKTRRDNTKFTKGDRVIVYPGLDVIGKAEFSEYITVSDPKYLVHVPTSMPLEEAAMLPSGALIAYNAVLQAKQIAERIVAKNGHVNILISGAGGLGLFTLKFADYFFRDKQNSVRIVVADRNLEKLMDADDIGCYDIIHWEDMLYEQQLVDRVLDVFNDGVDIAIDYACSVRTLKRILNCLNPEGGRILIGGFSRTQATQMDIDILTKTEEGIMGIPTGTIDQLQEIVKLFSSGSIKPPPFSVFPIEDMNEVYHDLANSKIHGRAVFRVAGSEDVF